MKQSSSLLLDFKSRAEASAAAAKMAETALCQGLDARGRASIVVSGGTTPGAMLETLSDAQLDWSLISVGLVDERYVPPGHEASNEAFVRQNLLQNRARKARFLPVWSQGDNYRQAACLADTEYARESPFDFTLLGMGTDGHTASWFPGAPDLEQALDRTGRTVISIDAQGCPVAGEQTERVTLTLKAISTARHAVLLIFGEEKRDVFLSALTRPEQERPIRAVIEALGKQLIVIWAP